MEWEQGGAARGSALLRALSAGSYLQGLERHADAVSVLAAAVQAQPAHELATADEARLFADTLITLAECQIESDCLSDSEETLGRLDGILLRLRELAPSPAPTLLARRTLCAARLAFWRRDVALAITLSREAVLTLAGGGEDLVHHAVWRLRADAILAANLSIAGHHDEAIALGRAALSRLDGTGLRELSRDSVRLTLNQGNAQWFRGDLEQALLHFRRVIDIAQGQFDAGCEPRAHDLGRAHMNLGGVLVSANRLTEALAAFRQALQIYSTQIRRSRRRGEDVRRLQASQAGTWMNLGYAHFRAREFGQAARWLGRARQYYARVAAELPHLHDDEARTWVNEGHLLLSCGRHARAARRYQAAIDVFEQRVAAGAEHLLHDLANARLGRAKSLAAAGRPAEAAELARQALDSYASLVAQGQLHHAQAWLEGLYGVIEALVTQAGSGSARRREGVGQALAVLGECLARAPIRGHPAGDEQLRWLDSATAQLSNWSDSSKDLRAFETLLPRLVRHLLNWLAGLLGDADPAWMVTHASALARSVEGLWQLSRKLPDSALLEADWYLCTRGLRAQRDALAHSTDPRVATFARLQAQLWRIEQELLAGTTLSGNAGDGLLRAAGISNSGSRENDRCAADWVALRDRCDFERARLVEDGLLPQRLRVSASDAASRLPQGVTLCLLARPRLQCIVVIVLRRLHDGALQAQSHELMLDSPLADDGCAQWLELVRRDLTETARGGALRRTREVEARSHPAGTGRADFAIAMLQLLADGVAASLKSPFGPMCAAELVLVPSDDLHLVPWRHLLARTWPEHPPLLQFPSVGAWLRNSGDAGRPKLLSCWSVAIGSDALESLPWVAIEAELSRRLWTAIGIAVMPLDTAKLSGDGVEALIGMGHGGAPTQRQAVGGLYLDHERALTAHDLPNIRHARCLVLSSCVLAQTHEVLGEPLGFLSEAFGYGVAFGTGWLTEVPDEVACLFSLAFQYVLRQRSSPRDGGRAVSVCWLDSFEATCTAIENGHWPASFAAWLTTELAALPLPLPHGAKPDTLTFAPPQALRQMLPWVIALGS